MYYRLAKYDELIEVLLKSGRVFIIIIIIKFHDASYILKKIPNIRMRLPPI